MRRTAANVYIALSALLLCVSYHSYAFITDAPRRSIVFYSGFSSGADWNVSVAKYRHDKVCAISYTFDDGLAEHYTLAAPQLEQRGFRGTFFINGSKVNKDERHIKDTTRVTWPQLKEMAEKGHEISNHGWAQATIIPVTTARGKHSFIGCESIQIIKPTVSTL